MPTPFLSALAMALAAQPPVPPQTTQLPPPPAPISGPETPLVEVDTRPYVALVTDLGTITVRIEDRRAPVTAANFLRYVDSKRMDGFVFYRSTRNWGASARLVQAGPGEGGEPNFPPVVHEPTTRTGLTHCRGALSMARLAPGDAAADFFLMLSGVPAYDADPARDGDNAGFAVFGEVIAGMEVAEAIYAAPVSRGRGAGGNGRPDARSGGDDPDRAPDFRAEQTRPRAASSRRHRLAFVVRWRRNPCKTPIIYFAFIGAVAIPRA